MERAAKPKTLRTAYLITNRLNEPYVVIASLL